MKLRLIRHACLIVEYTGHRLLVDPQLDPAGARPAIDNTPNPRNNPLVDLPIPVKELLGGVEAVLVTHTHRDHWDGTAEKEIPKDLPLIGQPEDELNRAWDEGYQLQFVVPGAGPHDRNVFLIMVPRKK